MKLGSPAGNNGGRNVRWINFLEDTTYRAQSLGKKRLDTLSRHIFMHTFCTDFGVALTFGWFGDAFLSTSVQKSAILADPVLTFYKVGIVELKSCSQPQHKTQNTKHKTQNTKHNTHNNQHEPRPPYLLAALPSTSMGRSVDPTTHGAAASYGLMPSARGLVWRRHRWLACLGV